MSGNSLVHFSDEELVTSLRDQPDAAFTAIYNRYWKTLLGMAYAALKDQAKAEEIVQDGGTTHSIW
ncbi:RNA polymerase sigma-70 factor, ECF subfamily [bacterium A37T11]|nr:RNA polymerase sigma-70 factor, ECF subfamily [bacterium A37T11]